MPFRRRLLAALACTGVGAACSSGGGDSATAGPTDATTTTPGLPAGETVPGPGEPVPAPGAPVPAPVPPASPVPAAPVWVVGAELLPLRPDGLGEILPTPAVLVDRRLPTADLLPPPASGAFESTIGPVDNAVRARMGGTLADGCPVGPDDLRYLTMSFRGFDGRAHTGEMVVHAEEAEDVVSVFRRLFEADFPLEEMRLITDADVAAPPTGDGNNSGAFICRAVRGGTRFSAHASGLAIDVNPFHNPYQRDDIVLPERASAYLDRGNVRPGMILRGDVVTEAFADIGWTWGGDFGSVIDTMHFSATGG
ncbi:MAG: M15 family metallopeptidase [Acidimicrobiales bacterium]